MSFLSAVALLLVFGALAGVALYALLSMAQREDRNARHMEHAIDPHSDVTITGIHR